MKIDGQHRRTVAFDAARAELTLIDQTQLPFRVEWLVIGRFAAACRAIADMQVRGAPAIGVTAAYAMALALRERLPAAEAAATLKATRPTAVNLAWATDCVLAGLGADASQHYRQACAIADAICEADVAACSAIGDAGCELIAALAEQKNGVVNILTHCNAGWLATVDWGTALAPVYKAQQRGIDVHVWVDETRPRNQGAALTCFELDKQGIAHTLICDNAGGHLMQQGLVDMCLVGSDRTAANGDVCNKIGTYLKALAARDNDVPFYVALPSSTIDWQLADGRAIPIEQRSADEVLYISGCNNEGQPARVRIAGTSVQAANPAFDVTPARLVSGLITEYGLVAAGPAALAALRQRL